MSDEVKRAGQKWRTNRNCIRPIVTLAERGTWEGMEGWWSVEKYGTSSKGEEMRSFFADAPPADGSGGVIWYNRLVSLVEYAAPKLTVPRVARSFSELKAGMRVLLRSKRGLDDTTVTITSATKDTAKFRGGWLVQRDHADWDLHILADPEEPAPIPRESSPSVLSPAETQALIGKCSAMVAVHKPCPTHNMPLPCVECALNASHTAAAFAKVALEAHEREQERHRAARELRERLVVLQPWAGLAGVQGPGWDRRGGR